MKNARFSGAVLATAVALAFIGTPAHAEDSSSSGAAAQVKCLGGNSCKGQSACKSAQSDCKGQNACKGKGYVMTPSAQECLAAGGKVDSTKKE